MLQSNYTGVDKTLSTSNKIADEFLKHLTEADDLDRFLEVYNTKIAKQYKLKKAKTAKTAIRYLLLFLSYKLIENLKSSLSYEYILNDDLFTNEYKKSISKAVNYATANKDIKVNNGVKQRKGYTAEIIGAGIAIAVVRRMRNRANIIIDCNGVKLANEKLIAKAIEITKTTNVAYELGNINSNAPRYTKFKFEAVIDNRTTPQCRSLHGLVFNLEEAQAGINIPPLHVNCRSSITLLP